MALLNTADRWQNSLHLLQFGTSFDTKVLRYVSEEWKLFIFDLANRVTTFLLKFPRKIKSSATLSMATNKLY